MADCVDVLATYEAWVVVSGNNRYVADVATEHDERPVLTGDPRKVAQYDTAEAAELDAIAVNGCVMVGGFRDGEIVSYRPRGR